MENMRYVMNLQDVSQPLVVDVFFPSYTPATTRLTTSAPMWILQMVHGAQPR